jgi:pyrroloquinoline quinone (PQQ) biosynthesis protein C
MASATREQPNHPTLQPILDAIADWVKKYRYAAGLRNELAQCGPEEVANTARELGLSSRDLYRMARKGPNAADLLQKMLLALGVSPQKLALEDPLIMRDLQRLCIMCGQKKQCKHELAAGTAGKNFRDFCPNAFTLEALLSGK